MYDRVAGKGGTFPRRYLVSLPYKDNSEGELNNIYYICSIFQVGKNFFLLPPSVV